MADESARLVVSVHDVSPATAEQSRRWCADADSLGIPVSLLVIPGPWRDSSLADEPGYADVLRSRVAGGDELVMHGWAHVAGPEGSWQRRALCRAVARGAAEFGALAEAEAAVRLASGQRVLAELGLTVRGFTPPGWLASPATNRALRRAGFRYTTSHWGLHDLRSGELRRGFALSHRPGGWTERLGAVALYQLARRGASRGGLVRIALHPDDLLRPRLRDVTLRSVEAVLRAGARAVTYGSLAPDAAEDR